MPTQSSDIARARAEGTDDKAIHDTVLIAAAFCMFNRYVDGLGTRAPEDPAAYEQSGLRRAKQGYVKYDFGKGGITASPVVSEPEIGPP